MCQLPKGLGSPLPSMDERKVLWGPPVSRGMRNVGATAILNALSDFVSVVIKDNVDEIAPEFRVSACFKTMCSAFDKDGTSS